MPHLENLDLITINKNLQEAGLAPLTVDMDLYQDAPDGLNPDDSLAQTDESDIMGEQDNAGGGFDGTGNPDSQTTGDAGDYSSLSEKARNVDVSSSAHQAVFYSGEGNRAQAEAFVQLNGKTTLEMTPGGKYFESLKLFDPGSPVAEDQALEIWKILSERYAKSASGNVYGFVKGSRPGSIFNTVEYQALQKNPYITNIFTELFK